VQGAAQRAATGAATADAKSGITPNRELRDLAHGILPRALTRGGQRAGVDRVSALGGRLNVESPAGGGTVVTATLPAA
jgi:hypothetical protein